MYICYGNVGGMSEGEGKRSEPLGFAESNVRTVLTSGDFLKAKFMNGLYFHFIVIT